MSVLLTAWRVAGRLPEPVLRSALALAADVAWVRRGGGVRRLEANLRRARPAASRRELRRLSRRGMRTYLRYFGEAFTLDRLTPAQIDARVRTEGRAAMEAVRGDGQAVLALGHLGNWDLAGAWAGRHLGQVTTVAERLEPPEVFEQFLAFRQALGMRILPLDRGGVFRRLVPVVRSDERGVVPLLADRDLSRTGVEVALLGEAARVAVGPAALAVATGVPLFPLFIRHERLDPVRRRAARSPWGIVLTFGDQVHPRAELERSERIAEATQQWVDQLGAFIAAHPEHWHMLQRVFVADLDPERLARTRERAGQGTGTDEGPGTENDPTPERAS